MVLPADCLPVEPRRRDLENQRLAPRPCRRVQRVHHPAVFVGVQLIDDCPVHIQPVHRVGVGA